MNTMYFDVVIFGGSLGGTIAAYSAAKSGKSVGLFEKTDWIGGQLTSQAVPPDEHRWIEETGCSATYRSYRNAVRNYYRNHPMIADELKNKEFFCPGGSTVSRLSHPPRLALKLLTDMLQPYLDAGTLKIFYRCDLREAKTDGDVVRSLTIKTENETFCVTGKYFLDADDEGELIYKSGCEYVTGAESREMTGEPSACERYMPEDRQPVTWSMAFENRRAGDYVIDKPEEYDYFVKIIMPYDRYPVFSMYGPDSSTGKAKRFGMFNGETDAGGNKLFGLFTYRRIINSAYFKDGFAPYDVTMLNWPQNDYFFGNTFDDIRRDEHRYLAKQLTKSFFYWLQTEAPNGDKKGYPFFAPSPESAGTDDGMTKTYYVRESRRIRAKFTVREQDLTDGNPDFYDSVGVGSYPIDLHITTKTHSFFYKPSKRFTIPLGAMIPVRIKNLIPACKNIGTTHLTGGCYRLHPVEWSVGEAAGFLASYAIDRNCEIGEVREDGNKLNDFLDLLRENGVQTHW